MNDEYNNIVGRRIRYFRQQAELSVAELGEKLGVSRQCVTGLECGRMLPDVLLIVSLAKIFSVEVEDFLREEDEAVQDKELQSVIDTMQLTDKELHLINRFRLQSPAHQKAIETILEVSE